MRDRIAIIADNAIAKDDVAPPFWSGKFDQARAHALLIDNVSRDPLGSIPAFRHGTDDWTTADGYEERSSEEFDGVGTQKPLALVARGDKLCVDVAGSLLKGIAASLSNS